MRLYHIAELEQLSGIRAATIRMWEKRYGLIRPGRTDTNIRLYDDGQVRKLLNVSTLLSNGYKISRVAAMQDEVLYEKIRMIQATSGGDEVVLAYIHELTAAVLEMNERAFERGLTTVIARYGLWETMLKVVYPLLQRLGILWATDKSVPVQEHFASAVLRRRLLAATDQLVITGRRRSRFLLMLPPGEWHETGLLFADYLIRTKDIETVYLGQNVPYENIPLVLSKVKITHLLLFYITPVHPDKLLHIRKRMGLPPDVLLLVAGNPMLTACFKKETNTVLLGSPRDLLEYL